MANTSGARSPRQHLIRMNYSLGIVLFSMTYLTFRMLAVSNSNSISKALYWNSRQSKPQRHKLGAILLAPLQPAGHSTGSMHCL
jgi:hypothetical protein